MLTSAEILDLVTAPPRKGIAGKVRAIANREGARWAGARTENSNLTARQEKFLKDIAQQPAPTATTYVHPTINAIARPRTPDGTDGGALSPAEVAWLTRLPTDPSQVAYDDAVVLAGMSADPSLTRADRRLVNQTWLPVKEIHDQRAAEVAVSNAQAATPPPIPSSALPALAETIAAETPELQPDEAISRASAALREAASKRANAAALTLQDAQAQLEAAKAAPAKRTAVTAA